MNKKTKDKIEKNVCGKTRTQNKPYEIWDNYKGWTWYVLKKYQKPSMEIKNPYARWLCLVKSPFMPNGELGDVYVNEIKSSAIRIYKDEPKV